MGTLGKRVRQVIAASGETMTSFAKELNISQSMVSKICSDKASPSNRTISDICQKYDIRREWLLSGEGEMMDSESLENEIVKCFHDSTLSDESSRKLASALAKIPPVGQRLVQAFFDEMVDSIANGKELPSTAEAYRRGYMDAARQWQELREKENALLLEVLSPDPEK